MVEDEYLVALSNEWALTDAGFGVAGIVASGEAALAEAERTRPDLALMDIRLAGRMDGIEVAAALRARGLRCLFASANADPGTRARGAAAEPLGWLQSPSRRRRWWRRSRRRWRGCGDEARARPGPGGGKRRSCAGQAFGPAAPGGRATSETSTEGEPLSAGEAAAAGPSDRPRPGQREVGPHGPGGLWRLTPGSVGVV